MNSDEHIIKKLLDQIERVCLREMKTPRDFERLSEELHVKRGEAVSANTLKHLWGYLPGTTRPRQYTLDCLARYLGYRDYGHFCDHEQDQDGEVPSNVVVSKRLDVVRELAVRDRVMLSWTPGRQCTVRYLGGGQFVVEASERTRLQAGDTFTCGLMMENEPLYLDNLIQQGRPPVGYVCGMGGGIHFDVVKADKGTYLTDED